MQRRRSAHLLRTTRMSREVTATTRGRAFVPLLLLLLVSVGAATSAMAGDEPIVLTNEDVVRLHGTQPKQSQPAVPNVSAPSTEVATEDDAAVVEYDARQLYKKTSRQTMNAARDAIDGHIDSWQEEYYRMKAEALRDAIARGDEIEFSASDAPPAAPAADESPRPQASHGSDRRACLYGAVGQLLHEPKGLDCPAVRRNRLTEAADATKTDRAPSVGCVYGSRGQLLYKSDGAVCE